MNSEVTILAPLAAALFEDEHELRALRVDGDDQIVDCTPQISLLLSSSVETTQLHGVASRDALVGRLRFETAKHRALTFLLAGADQSLRHQNRRGSILLAEKILQSPEVREFVERRLLGCKPSTEADFKAAKDLALEEKAHVCVSLYMEVCDYGDLVERVLRHFQEVILYENAAYLELQPAIRSLVDAGVIAAAVRAVGEKDVGRLASFALAYSNTAELKSIPRFSHLLTRISQRLREDFDLDQSVETPMVIGSTVLAEEDSWLNEINAWIATREERKWRFKKHIWVRRDINQVRLKVDHQVEYIQRLLQKQDMVGVEDTVLDLIRHQRKNSELRHVCKSLSRLGAIAVDCEGFELAERLYRAAETANDLDSVVFSGRAQMLREMGRLKEALEAYAETKRRFQNDPVPFNGYAETLREMGRLNDALAAYGDAKERFANTSVPLCGYAETLREMGRLDDALSAYAEAKERFQEEPVAFNGYSETLREMGRLDDALSAYTEAKERFEHDPVPFNGYAETLREMGRLDDALAAYANTKELFQNDPFPFNGYAATLRDLGRLADAQTAYREAIQRFPRSRVATNALASLLVNTDDPTGAIALLPTNWSPRSKRDWRDFHVVAMAYYRMGQTPEALRRLEFGIKKAPFYRVNSLFRCTLAAQKLQEKRVREALDLLSLQNNTIPFPEWAIVKAHAEAETNQLDAAKADLRRIRYRYQLRRALEMLTQFCGLDQRSSSQPQRGILSKELWTEEFRLLTLAAA